MRAFDHLNGLTEQELTDALTGDQARRVDIVRTAAEGGAVDAQLLLGQMHLDGKEVPRDPIAALGWFGRAATAGHPMGMNMVGRCLENGWGTRADKAAAVAWYEAAAGRGLDWGLYNLATLLALGEGVPRDLDRALALFRRAAAMGHAKSMTMVGSFHEDGWAVTTDREAARAWYRRGASAGDFRGQFNHARLLIEDGRIDEALPWLMRVPATATPRFVAQVRAWLADQPSERLRQLALDLPEEIYYARGSH